MLMGTLESSHCHPRIRALGAQPLSRLHVGPPSWFGSLALVVLMLSSGRCAFAQSAASWERLAGPLDPPPASGHQVIHDPLRHRLLLLDVGALDVLWSMSLPANGRVTWTRAPIAGPRPRDRFGFCAAYDPRRDRVLLFGGSSSENAPVYQVDANDVWALSLTGTPTWTQIAVVGDPPAARSDAVFIYDPVRDRMVMFGGTNFYPDDLWSLDLAGSPTWRKLSPAGTRAPVGREGAGAVYDRSNDRIVMFGGWAPSGGGILADTWSLSLAGETRWDSLSTNLRPAARRNFSAIVDPVRAELVIANGHGWQYGWELDDAWAFDLTGSRGWTQIAVSGDVPTVGSQCAVFSPENRSLIQYGGGGNGTFCSELTLDDHRWTSLLPAAPDPMPIRRGLPKLVADPAASRLLVYGGLNWGCMGDLWAFSLAGDASWTPLPLSGTAPVCTADHVVFDPLRRRLLAFVSGLPARVGTLVDEVWALPLDEPRVWTKLSPLGPLPPGRIGFSVVYDPKRDRMLLFGGQIYNRNDITGESQDDLWELSLADTLRWRQLQPRNSPGERQDHAAVYDPARDRMIVFEGNQSHSCRYGCTTALSDLWALSLASDSLVWQRLNPDAPFPAPLTTGTPKVCPIVLDGSRDRLVVLPGDASAWTFSLSDSVGWQPLNVDGELPTQRTLAGFVFDPTRDRLFLMGGLQAVVPDYGAFSADVYALRFAGTPGTPGTQVALRASRVTPTQVELSWSGLAALQPASVVRADADEPFHVLASLTADASGGVAYRDATVVPGKHYRYSLSIEAGARRLGEASIDVPFAPAFALAGAHPNPAVGELSLAFSLLDAAPARLEVFDLAGRRVAGRDVGALGAGRHLLSVGQLVPGAYLVRLSSGSRSVTSRVAVVR